MAEKKQTFLQTVYSDVSSSYERINHILTLGLDTYWRRRAVKIASASNQGRWADMCTGTAELAAMLKRHATNSTQVYGFDFSLPMLLEGAKKNETLGIKFTTTDVRFLPLANESLDLATSSFATRNINLSRDILTETFAEYYRVLKPGGRFVNLETSIPPSPIIRAMFNLYIRLFVKVIGSAVSGSSPGYAYLAKSIPSFYSAEQLAEIMINAGFKEVRVHRQMLGAVAIHEAIK
jgi:demethylmenaquinone methyltransferase / 2-methoxy-6-polyprenyl-1,4-benzoquinol methylase